MFRLRGVNTCLRRLFHVGAVNREQVLEQLQGCSAEHQVFDVVGQNRGKLTVSHLGCAVGKLWQFQKVKPDLVRDVDITRSHPEFKTLQVLAENTVSLMDDLTLVDVLYCLLRLNVNLHDFVIQQLVLEACQRLDRLPMASLSKFAICLNDRYANNSPIIGKIANIVEQKLSSIDDPRILTSLMICIAHVVSPRLRDALLSRADHLLDLMEKPDYNIPRKIVQFMRSSKCSSKCSSKPLLEKCNQLIMRTIPTLDSVNIGIIMGLYQWVHYNNCDFTRAIKQRLIELIDSSADPLSFTKLFISLTPIASPEIREGLENTALLLADEFSAQHVLDIVVILQVGHSRNVGLLDKLAVVIQRNLDQYKPQEIAKLTHALCLLQYDNPQLFSNLRTVLLNLLQRSFIPSEVALLVRALAMLPRSSLDKTLASRIDAVVTQCNLKNLKILSAAVTKWAWRERFYRRSNPSDAIRLLQTLNRCGLERLRAAERLGVVLDELKYTVGEWLEETLLDDVMAMLQRMMDQINWTNVPDVALFITRFNYLCPPLMDRIATVTIEDIDKIHYSEIYSTLLPFSILNYNSAQADELFDVCIQHITPHISSIDPHLLVFQAYSLALANYFPEKLIREIFTINFLERLDSHFDILPFGLHMQTRLHLMELNRAVCLECPQFQVPWFHDSYCEQHQSRGAGINSPVQQQIHKMLGQILGGVNYVRAGVVTPYFYTINFEYILDKHKQPLPYSRPSALEVTDDGRVSPQTSLLEDVGDELPPGAQRVAVEFVYPKGFCKNSHRMRGETLMRKRHLEILGYRVVQIPHFEWNSMALSSVDAWKDYLKKKMDFAP